MVLTTPDPLSADEERWYVQSKFHVQWVVKFVMQVWENIIHLNRAKYYCNISNHSEKQLKLITTLSSHWSTPREHKESTILLIVQLYWTLKTWPPILPVGSTVWLYWLNKRFHHEEWMHTSLGWPSDLLAFCMVVYLRLVSSPSSQTEVSERLLAVSYQTYTHRRIKGESKRGETGKKGRGEEERGRRKGRRRGEVKQGG